MNKRDEDEHQIDTVPPPPGEDDAYSAETRIGKIPSDLLQAMKRAHASEATGRPSLDPGARVTAPAPPPAARVIPRPTPAAGVPAVAVPASGGGGGRPLSVPRVTPTIPPPAETAPVLQESMPSFGGPPVDRSGRAAALPPPPPAKADAMHEFTLEDLVSDEHDYVGSMLGLPGTSPVPAASGRPATASNGPPVVALAPNGPAAAPSVVVSDEPPSGPPAVAVYPITDVGSTSDAAPVVVPLEVPSNPPADVVAAVADAVGAAGVMSVPHAPPIDHREHRMPPPEAMRMMEDSHPEEGSMSFAPFMEQSRRLNIVLMVSIGILLFLTIVVLIAAK